MANRIHFAFMCVGHLFDHLFMLIFATVAALSLSQEWSMSYAELIPYATPGFVAIGVCAVPAGWVADKWSRKGMIWQWQRACEKAGVPVGRMYEHTRHSSATAARETLGEDQLTAVQKMLGHSNLRTTEVYSRHKPASLVKLVRKD